jgi:hypothetical protein
LKSLSFAGEAFSFLNRELRTTDSAQLNLYSGTLLLALP